MQSNFLRIKKVIAVFAVSLIVVGYSHTFAQENKSGESGNKLIEELTYQTQDGLPLAASKIYFTDSKFTVSGFGEMNYINYLGPKDINSGDIELYYTNLYRFVSYVAYKPLPWLVLYGEIFGEVYQDGFNAYDSEFFIETFADFLIHDKLNLRVGTSQVHVGYINNNDEPVMYYSVNRPDVERLIIPSQWIDFGAIAYGNINKNVSYALGVFQGLDAGNYRSGTWLRGGREHEFRLNFNSLVYNGKIGYTGIKNTELTLNGIWTRGGNNQTVADAGIFQPIRGNTSLINLYGRHKTGNWTFMALASYGRMNDTEKIFELTKKANEENELANGQVLGSEVYGLYLEVGYDVLPLLRKGKDSDKNIKNRFYRSDELKLPIFARIERLNTHAGIHPALVIENRYQSDLTALTMGLNFNTRKNIVFKTNYQFRFNKQPLSSGEMEGDRLEFGVGFIF